MTQLAVAGAYVRLGDKAALDGVTAAFEPGRITAIVGPNGAGKSTLLMSLTGLRRPDRGQVLMGDVDLYSLPSRSRAQRIGYLPQIPEVAWAVDVRTLVGLGRTPFIGARGLSAADDAVVDRVLSTVGIGAMAHRNVMTLSGGERARALIARMLAGEPQWLLVDEPLAGLDPGFQLDVAELFRRMAVEEGCGVIITLHDLHMALRIADRVLILDEGRIRADDKPVHALSPAILAEVYGVKTRFWDGDAGPMIEIVGRHG